MKEGLAPNQHFTDCEFPASLSAIYKDPNVIDDEYVQTPNFFKRLSDSQTMYGDEDGKLHIVLGDGVQRPDNLQQGGVGDR